MNNNASDEITSIYFFKAELMFTVKDLASRIPKLER